MCVYKRGVNWNGGNKIATDLHRGGEAGKRRHGHIRGAHHQVVEALVLAVERCLGGDGAIGTDAELVLLVAAGNGVLQPPVETCGERRGSE